jgi:DNA-binding transcriptional MocR family regulator
VALSPLEAIRRAKAIAVPPHLSHALLVLATYYPNIWPGQERLAQDMHVSRATVNRRLRELEERGLIVRRKRRKGAMSTTYRLELRRGYLDSLGVSPTIQEEQYMGVVIDPQKGVDDDDYISF